MLAIRAFTASLLALTLAACAATGGPQLAPAPALPNPVVAAPAPLADLVQAVDIPYESFTLTNGLTTLVHTDRKAPIVGVMLYYRVGSKHEPRGRTGFAHLYEHFFFGGSENVENYDIPLEAAGSTPTNGSTWYDRTNYYETVPTGALELALFQESDRMGHLLGAVTQDKIDRQRGVVQNEKRQGDNDPYGLFDYAQSEGLLPVGHPYRHSVIGSMADLDAASMADVHQWFRSHYGPNNVVLALTGDIDAATARPLVEKWFGDIPRGADVPKVEAGPVTLDAPRARDMKDSVPVLRITRNWTGPGLNDPDAPALDTGMRILGGLASSRLDNALVRGEEIAVAVTASAQAFEQLSFLQVSMDVKPGVDRARAEARLDAVVADYLAQGPTADEVRRAATSAVSEQIGALEHVGGYGGKGATLAEGQLYSGNPAKFRDDLAAMARLTPAEVQAALQRWLSRPALALAVVPGERSDRGEAMGGWGDEGAAPIAQPPRRKKAVQAIVQPGPHRDPPPVAAVGDLAFPVVERASLSNGIPVVLARRTAVPKLIVSLGFDAGHAADALDGPGTQGAMLAMLEEGTTSRNATQIAEEQERLGAALAIGAGADSSAITLSALTANLAPSLALMADVARNPAFAGADLARVQSQRRADLAQVYADPGDLGRRVLARLLYGPQHPYGQGNDGLGDPAGIDALTPDLLRQVHARWLRPDAARITVTGDITMARLLPLLEAAFGQWQAPSAPRPVKDLAAATAQPMARIVLIDRPNTPQAVILAGRVLPITGRDPGYEALDLANEVLGNGFLSRLNMNLREDKSWTYGVSSMISSPLGPRAFSLETSVETGRTGDSIREILKDMAAFPARKPVDAVELGRVTDGNIRGLPTRFETNAQVLYALVQNGLLGRADDYQSTLPSRWRAIDATAIDSAARRFLQGDGLVFVVVGDRALIEPQLKGIGLPVEFAEAPKLAAN